MKKISVLIVCIFFFLLANGQTAKVIVLSLNSGLSVQSVDLKVVEYLSGTTVAQLSSIPSFGSSSPLIVPSNMTLIYELYESGTSNLLKSYNFIQHSTGGFDLVVLYSGGGQSWGNFLSDPYDSTIVQSVTYNSSNLTAIDVMIRGGAVIADDVSKSIINGNSGSTGEEINGSSSTIIDVFSSSDPGVGIGAFNFDPVSLNLAGEAVYFVVTGSSSDLDMYAFDNEGVFTKLTETTPINTTGIDDELYVKSDLKVMPNPFIDDLSVNFDIENQNSFVSLSMVNINGKLIHYVNETDNYSNQLKFNVKDVPAGMYIIKLELDNQTIIKKVIKN